MYSQMSRNEVETVLKSANTNFASLKEVHIYIKSCEIFSANKTLIEKHAYKFNKGEHTFEFLENGIWIKFNTRDVSQYYPYSLFEYITVRNDILLIDFKYH